MHPRRDPIHDTIQRRHVVLRVGNRPRSSTSSPSSWCSPRSFPSGWRSASEGRTPPGRGS